MSVPAPSAAAPPPDDTATLIAALREQNKSLAAAVEHLAAAAPPRPPAEVSDRVVTLIREYAQLRSRLASVGEPDPTSPAHVVAIVPEAGPVGQEVLLFVRGAGRIKTVGFADAGGDSIGVDVRPLVRDEARREQQLGIVGTGGTTRRVTVATGEQVLAATVPAKAVSGRIAVATPESTVLSPRFEVTAATPTRWPDAVLSAWDGRTAE